MQDARPGARRQWAACLLVLATMGTGLRAFGQQPPPPPDSPPPAATPAVSREAQLEERLRKLEAMNQRILQQYEAMEKKHSERYDKLSQDFQALQQRVADQ